MRLLQFAQSLVAILSTLAAGSCQVVHGQEAQAVEQPQREQALIEAGHRQSDAGHFCEAWQAYAEAASLHAHPSAGLMFAVGRAAYKAGVWDQAILALRSFLEAGSDPAAEALVQSWLSDASTHVARCSITSDAGDPAELEIKGEASPPTALSQATCGHRDGLAREAGRRVALLNLDWSYELTGSLHGQRMLALTRRVETGTEAGAGAGAGTGTGTPASEACALHFMREPPIEAASVPSTAPSLPSAARAAPPINVVPAPSPHPSRGIPTLTYAAWGGGVLALGGMTGALIMREAHVSDWNSDRCLTAGKTRGQNCADLHSDYQAAQNWAIGTGIASAALIALGGVIWLLEPNEDKPSRAAWQCAPSVGPAALCALRF